MMCKMFPRLWRKKGNELTLMWILSQQVSLQSTQSHLSLIDKQSCILRKATFFKECSLPGRSTAAPKPRIARKQHHLVCNGIWSIKWGMEGLIDLGS